MNLDRLRKVNRKPGSKDDRSILRAITEIESQRQTIQYMEEDAGCCPEDQSVTETVYALRADIDHLTTQLSDAKAEIERLKALNRELLGGLEEALFQWEGWHQNFAKEFLGNKDIQDEWAGIKAGRALIAKAKEQERSK